MENGNETNPFTVNGSSGAIPKIDPGTIGTETGAGTPSANGGSHSASAGTGAGTEPVRKRGRPKGSKNRIGGISASGATQTKTVRVDRDAISAILFSAHAMLAGITKIPEIALDESEAKTIAEASAKVGELYELTADPKTIAWGNLAMTLGMVYGPRFVAISMRKKSERQKRAQSNVTPIRNGVSDNVTMQVPGGGLPPFEFPDGKTRQ